MTEHSDIPPHDPDAEDPGDHGAAPEPDAATVARLRALLRDEPVQDDDLARERRLRAALEAGPTSAQPSVGRVAAVPPPRRAARPWLVAAAVVVAVGLGGYVTLSISGSGSDEESADMATAADGSDPSLSPQDESAESSGGGQLDATATTTVAESDAALDSGAADSTAAGGQVADLGTFADIAALRAAVDPTARAVVPPVAPTAQPRSALLPCVEQQLALGTEVLGVAVVGTAPVVVVRTPAGVQVLDASTCEPSTG